MRVALVYPPSCDPTAPYLAVPTLAAWLRREGIDVLSIDANVDAWDSLLRRAPLAELAQRLERRLARLERSASLAHVEQLAYAALWGARGDACAVPDLIEDAVATLRDPERFFDRGAYEGAVETIEAAQRVISAAYAPLELDFVAYRTPFSLLSAEEIAEDARAERDPFHASFEALATRLSAAGVSVVGLSVAFPGQLQPAFSLAHRLRARLPGVHLTCGGPAMSQLFMRLEGEARDRALGPFDSTIIGEGEVALTSLVRSLERGERPERFVRGEQLEDLSRLPVPDFEGLPLDRYLAPELVLPYDPSRGCYWGVCTFCHYGLAEVGTARFRERPVADVMAHLGALSERHGTRIFYFSQDVFAPATALKIATAIRDGGLPYRFGSDMRPEKSLTPERCKVLAEGGALGFALGVESASPRVLQMIDKGIPAETVRRAVENLDRAGVAVEAMCFSDFPTESYREAMETVRFVESLGEHLSLFICGEFDLTHGALVAQRPGDFGIAEVWNVAGDELKSGLFYAEKRTPKRAGEHERLDEALGALSARWRLRRYPWAGALSTAHTLLFYERFGKDVFRRLAAAPPARVPSAKANVFSARFDVTAVGARAAASEAEIWDRLVRTDRRVGRAPYRALAEALPHALPSPRRYRCVAGEPPAPLETRGGRASRRHGGRRQRTAPSSMKGTPAGDR